MVSPNSFAFSLSFALQIAFPIGRPSPSFPHAMPACFRRGPCRQRNWLRVAIGKPQVQPFGDRRQRVGRKRHPPSAPLHAFGQVPVGGIKLTPDSFGQARRILAAVGVAALSRGQWHPECASFFAVDGVLDEYRVAGSDCGGRRKRIMRSVKLTILARFRRSIPCADRLSTRRFQPSRPAWA